MKNLLLITFCLLISSVTFGQGSETFDNTAPALPGSYSTGSLVGDNSVTWNYVASRDEAGFEITNDGLMLRRSSDNSSVSATVPGGIGDFTCKLKKAYTGSGNRQVQLFVNGVSQGTSIAFDNTTTQTFTVSGINVSGSVTIKIDNITSKQVVIDDISWTGYDPSVPGITLTAISGNTTEAGGTATFDVTLNTAPTTDVVIDVASGNTGENIVSPTTLTFNNGNYNVAQTVTVTGVDDVTADGNQITGISLTVNDAASDNAYDGLSESINVINEDDDCGISGVTVLSGCSGDDATFVVSWTEVNSSGTIEVDVNGNGYVTMTSGATYTITGPTTAASGVTVTVRDLNEPTCLGTTTTDIFACPQAIPEIYISEASDASASANEFIEFYNNSNFAVDLTGYKLVRVNASNNTSEYVFDFGNDETGSGSGSDLVIPSKGFFVVTRGGASRASFETAFPSFPAAAAYSRGNSNLFIGTGTARRWRLRANDGTANTDDGTLIDDTNAAVAGNGSNDRDYQNTPGNWTSSTRATATPGEFDGAQVLPVELLHFSTKAQNQTAILSWSTASEENNAYFDVQRSFDGINFETIGQVEGAGTTYDVQEYSFIDESPVNGVNYYRLKQVDFDGQSENHRIVSVMMNGLEQDVQVYPNPTNGELNIVLPTTGVNEIQIMDLTGKIVRTMNTADEGITTLNISDLANGQYIIRIRNANSISTALFVKNR